MSKRFLPGQYGFNKRPKLDISISEHKLPLSQNHCNKEADTWGDDNDDEILLLASQACEEAYNGDDSQLPDYSLCMQPPSTSTQMSPSTSKTDFTFKKPSTNLSHITTNNLREKCNRISSPLPGITSKVMTNGNEQVDLTDEIIFNDRVFKGQDSDQFYRQLLQLREENEKLKSENGKLLEKCVTKEGEASILRTQLKTCQVAVDNARLDKIKAQEKVQMEWTQKLEAVNAQLSNLRTQLDFKNLEIISTKEKCKKLESNKVRLTQVNVGANDISQRPSTSYNDTSQIRKVKTSSNSVQTEDKAQFIVLYKTYVPEIPPISILPTILEPSLEQSSLLDNEKLLNNNTSHKLRVFTTFQALPSTVKLKETKCTVQLSSLYGDLSSILSGSEEKDVYFNMFNTIKCILLEVENKLDSISSRITSAFQKEMDERYIDITSTYLHVDVVDLLKGRCLYNEEQDIKARRATAILFFTIKNTKALNMFHLFEKQDGDFIENVHKICTLLDTTSCGLFYSSLLLSVISVLTNLVHSQTNSKYLDILKTVIISRPMPFVIVEVLKLLTKVSTWERFSDVFCPKSNAGNLKLDYDQGVLLYKKDSCTIQIFLKQLELCLKCIENQTLPHIVIQTTRQLILLFSNINCSSNFVRDKSRCDCHLILIQVLVYSLKITAEILNSTHTEQDEVLSVCRCGIQILYQCTLRDVEFSSHLSYQEGHMMQFCEIVRRYDHTEVYANMLTEITGTLQSTPEEMPPSFHRQAWLNSFQSFSMAD